MDSFLPDLWQLLSIERPGQRTLHAADACVPTVFGVRLCRTASVLGRLGFGMIMNHRKHESQETAVPVALEQFVRLDGLATPGVDNGVGVDKLGLSTLLSSLINS